MMTFANAMIAAGQNSQLNLAFHFLRLYHFLFRRISHGASRLQELLADRVAAMQYGADAFEEGLRHVIRRSAEFVFAANQEAEAALASGRAFNNFYNLPVENASEVDSSVEKTLSEPASEDDTHPCANDRFRMVRDLITPRKPSDSAMVWDLFANRESLTMEMSKMISDSVRADRQCFENTEGLQQPKHLPTAKTGVFHRCAVCSGRIVFGGYKDGDIRYCSAVCYTAGPIPGFCQNCTTATTDESPGNTSTYNSIGTSLRPSGPRCPNCHSVPAKKWFVILLIPIIPLKSYRVRWINHLQYVGRRLSAS